MAMFEVETARDVTESAGGSLRVHQKEPTERSDRQWAGNVLADGHARDGSESNGKEQRE